MADQRARKRRRAKGREISRACILLESFGNSSELDRNLHVHEDNCATARSTKQGDRA
jgi:hypothetical protein